MNYPEVDLGNRKNAYIYPLSARSSKGLYNPYLDNFMKSLDNEFLFVNKDNPSNLGIIQLAEYLPKIDYIFLNWIENLPDRKGGVIQCLLVPLVVLCLLVKGTKIVWIMHNKISHKSSRLFLKKSIFSLMSRFSHLIITHSSEGLRFLEARSPKAKSKTIFLHHPVVLKCCPASSQKRYDILIWGTMHLYKGIYEFVSYCVQNPRACQLKILIAGKFIDERYYQKVIKQKTDNIEVLNAFIDDQQVLEYSCLSRFILFPYSGESVLSSGALMDSVGMLANIIGPRAGAFSDLAQEGIVSIFTRYDDIIDIIREPIDDQKRREKLMSFALDNSWDNFAYRINKYL